MRTVSTYAAAAGTMVVGGVFLASAAGKVLAPSRLSATIEAMIPGGAPAGSAPFLAYMLIGWEAALATALLFRGWRSRAVLWLALATLAMLTLALWRLSAVAPGASCGCLGLFETLRGEGARSGGWGWSFARNAALLWICVYALRTLTRGSANEHVSPDRAPVAPMGVSTRLRAFTLIEVLVVVSLLALLAALTFPALRSSTHRARESRSANTLRQSLAALSAYAADQRDAWPYFQTPGRFDGPIVVLGRPVSFSYFYAGRAFWASPLVPTYLADASAVSVATLDAVRARNIEDGFHPEVVRSSIELSASAFARPEWFAADLPMPSEKLLAPTTHADLAFPSRKGVLLDWGLLAPGDDPSSIPSALMCGRGDGSARTQPLRGAGPSFVVERWRFGVPTCPVMSTRDGWRGIDFGM